MVVLLGERVKFRAPSMGDTLVQTRDDVVTGIQRRALAGDIAPYRIIKTPIKPLWLQPVLVNRVENLRVFGL